MKLLATLGDETDAGVGRLLRVDLARESFEEVLAWTPGTDGVVHAEVVQIDRPRLPTKDELDIYLSSVADKVRDKIVFVGEHKSVPIALDPPTTRRDDAQVLSQYDPVEPVPFRFGRRRRGPRDDGKLDRRAVNKAIALFLVAVTAARHRPRG